MKHNPVIAHNTDANMIITFVSIGAGSCPDTNCIKELRPGALVYLALRERGVGVVTGE
jgi:hypothetical protein